MSKFITDSFLKIGNELINPNYIKRIIHNPFKSNRFSQTSEHFKVIIRGNYNYDEELIVETQTNEFSQIKLLFDMNSKK